MNAEIDYSLISQSINLRLCDLEGTESVKILHCLSSSNCKPGVALARKVYRTMGSRHNQTLSLARCIIVVFDFLKIDVQWELHRV